MQDKIGEVAGNVWDFLDERGKTSVTEVAESVNASAPKAYMAIGWLAEEGKLEFSKEGRGTNVSLK